jgi:hypothetical protein
MKLLFGKIVIYTEAVECFRAFKHTAKIDARGALHIPLPTPADQNRICPLLIGIYRYSYSRKNKQRNVAALGRVRNAEYVLRDRQAIKALWST